MSASDWDHLIDMVDVLIHLGLSEKDLEDMVPIDTVEQWMTEWD